MGSFTRKTSIHEVFHRSHGFVPDIIPPNGVTLLCLETKFGKSWWLTSVHFLHDDPLTLGTIKPVKGNVAVTLALRIATRRLQRRRQS